MKSKKSINHNLGKVTVVLIVFVLCSLQGYAEENYVQYHYKKPFPLKLDTSQIAIYEPGTQEAVLGKLQNNNITIKSIKRFAITGWWLVEFPQNMDYTSADIETIIKDIDNTSTVAFVSPVFIGNYGPLIITRIILLGFHEWVPDKRAEEILREAHIGDILKRNWANMQGAYKIKSSAGNGFVVLRQANKLAQLPEVNYAEPNMIITGKVGTTN